LIDGSSSNSRVPETSDHLQSITFSYLSTRRGTNTTAVVNYVSPRQPSILRIERHRAPRSRAQMTTLTSCMTRAHQLHGCCLSIGLCPQQSHTLKYGTTNTPRVALTYKVDSFVYRLRHTQARHIERQLHDDVVDLHAHQTYVDFTLICQRADVRRTYVHYVNKSSATMHVSAGNDGRGTDAARTRYGAITTVDSSVSRGRQIFLVRLNPATRLESTAPLAATAAPPPCYRAPDDYR